MELNELEQAVRNDFTERRMAIDNDALGKRPQDLAYQIAWNVYHLANNHQPVYPHQMPLMQKLGYVAADGKLTESGQLLGKNMALTGFYQREGVDIL